MGCENKCHFSRGTVQPVQVPALRHPLCGPISRLSSCVCVLALFILSIAPNASLSVPVRRTLAFLEGFSYVVNLLDSWLINSAPCLYAAIDT